MMSDIKITRTFLDGAPLRSLDPETAERCRREYWRSRTFGMSDEELMKYLIRPDCPLVIDPLKEGEEEGLH
jgi:hypothetical protein